MVLKWTLLYKHVKMYFEFSCFQVLYILVHTMHFTTVPLINVGTINECVFIYFNDSDQIIQWIIIAILLYPQNIYTNINRYIHHSISVTFYLYNYIHRNNLFWIKAQVSEVFWICRKLCHNTAPVGFSI